MESNTKQDERTPGKSKLVYDKKSRTIVTVRTSDAAAEPSQNCNAYTSTDALRSALQAAEQFIVNGVEFGFIRMPDPPDSALDTLPKIRAALSASPAPSTEGSREWQPIETAPRDGTKVLLFAPGWAAPSTGWTYANDPWQDCPWRRQGNPSYEPTHWMPLPPAPDAARTALAGVTTPETQQGGLSKDKLRMDYINSLPQPFLARFCGDHTWWPVNDFEVETGLMRIDVCGLLQVKSFGEVMELRDGDGKTHDPDSFYSDYDEPSQNSHAPSAGVTAPTEKDDM